MVRAGPWKLSGSAEPRTGPPVGIGGVGKAPSGRGAADGAPDREPAPFDAFAGGYPVPPMPGQATASASSRPVSSTATSATSDGSVE